MFVLSIFRFTKYIFFVDTVTNINEKSIKIIKFIIYTIYYKFIYIIDSCYLGIIELKSIEKCIVEISTINLVPTLWTRD